VDALAARFASAPTRGLAIKRMIRESWSHSLDEELELQRDMMRELGFSATIIARASRLHGKAEAEFHGGVDPHSSLFACSRSFERA
jgi:predicted nucleic acid-binding protein